MREVSSSARERWGKRAGTERQGVKGREGKDRNPWGYKLL